MRYILFLLFATLLTGCENNNELLKDSWYLINVNGDHVEANSDFERGEIRWEFKDTNIIIHNKNIDKNKIDFIESGSYPFSKEERGDVEFLIVNGLNMGIIQFSDGKMSLDQRPVDGLQLVFIR